MQLTLHATPPSTWRRFPLGPNNVGLVTGRWRPTFTFFEMRQHMVTTSVGPCVTCRGWQASQVEHKLYNNNNIRRKGSCITTDEVRLHRQHTITPQRLPIRFTTYYPNFRYCIKLYLFILYAASTSSTSSTCGRNQLNPCGVLTLFTERWI